MLGGPYKVEMHTVHGSRRGVLYFYDGKMMGRNSTFAFIGTYTETASGKVLADMMTLRHNEDQNLQPLLKTDIVTLTLTGRQQGEQYYFEGGAPQLPGVVFYAAMTPISEESTPPIIPVGEGGVSNGLYSIHIRMLDGIDGGNTGVMMLDPRRRRVLRLYRLLYRCERPMEGRICQSRAHAKHRRAANVRRLRGRHRLFRHPYRRRRGRGSDCACRQAQPSLQRCAEEDGGGVSV
jgi:hypothetical protein